MIITPWNRFGYNGDAPDPQEVPYVITFNGRVGSVELTAEDIEEALGYIPGSGGGGGIVAWADITGKPTEFTPSAHTHVIADVTGLQAALDGKQPLGSYLVLADLTWSNISGKPLTFAPSAHTHPISDVVNLQTSLDGKSNVGHTHVIADVTNLQTTLDGKLTQAAADLIYAPISHTQTYTTVTGVPTGTIFYRKTASTGAAETQTLATLKTDLGLTGTNSGDQTIALSGAVSGSGTGAITTTLGAGAVTLSNMANVNSGTVFYRKTASAGAPEVQTLATLKTDLGLTGTNSGDQTITLTGPVTGSGTGSFATTITDGAVTLAKMASVNSGTVFYRKTASAGVPEVQTLATLKTDLGLTGTNSGDQTSIVGITGTTAQFNTALTDGDFATGGGTATGTNTGDQFTSTTASRILGRGSASGAGAAQEITLGTNLSMSGTTLNATGGGLTDGDKGDVVVASSGASLTVESATPSGGAFLVTGSMTMQQVGANRYAVAYAPNVWSTPSWQLSSWDSVAGAAIGLDILGGPINFRHGTTLVLNTQSDGVKITGVNAFSSYATGSTVDGTMWFDGTKFKKREGGVTSDIGTSSVTGLANPQTGADLVRIENTAGSVPAGAAGSGLELIGNNASSNVSILQSYNRTTAAFIPTNYRASTHDFYIGGVNMRFQIQDTVVASGVPLTVPDDAFAAGWNSSVQVPTKNAVYDAAVAMLSSYRTILDSSGSHIAARVAGTYGMGQGDPLAISGTGTLYPLNIMYIDPNDYPSAGGLTAKMRLRANVAVNDVAPTGNYTIGLHPVTRPATSGGAGLDIYTIGAAVSGSTVSVNAPAADSHTNAVGSDFAVPAAGFYVIGVVTTATVAASSHMHFSAALQLRHT